jgi:hypothetical protein
LFPEATEIEITPLTSLTAQNYSTFLRPKSRVVLVRWNDRQPELLKLARPTKITEEVTRYKQFVEGRLVGTYCTPIKTHCNLWDIGGAVYPFLGAERFKPFSDYYEQSQEEDIVYSLDQFFTITWKELYKKRKNTTRRIDIFEAYNQVWGENWYRQRLAHFSPVIAGQVMPGSWLGKDVPEPIQWLTDKIQDPQSRPGKVVPQTSLAVTHGDLHADNMLVDNNRSIWVVDFERTGFGPILQDIVELEADIISRLANLETGDFRSFYQLCIWAASHRSLEVSQSPILKNTPKLEKAVMVIRRLRCLANGISPDKDTRPYLWGLLLNALFRVSLATSGPPYPQETLRSLMFASILCHRLDHWNEDWPPSDWPPLYGKED